MAVPATGALGQSAVAAQADRTALAQGLQAQYEVALIRERKLADDRETTLIGGLEARLKQARAAAAAAQGDARQANAALASARADYAKLAAQISQRDASTEPGLNAYKAETRRIVAQASPEKLDALQRFADGDRVGAWPAIKAMTLADMYAPGATAALRVASLQELAALRDIMRAHGEADTAEVLGYYDQVAAILPSDFRTQIERARLANDLGDLTRAHAAADLAVTVATNDAERGIALKTQAEQSAAQGDSADALKDYDQALAMLQRIAASDASAKPQNDVAAVLQDKGDLLSNLSEYPKARESFTEALAIRQRLAAADPNNTVLENYVTSVLQRIGDLDIKTGDLKGARADFEQGLAIRQQLAANDPTNTDLQYYESAMLRRTGDLALKQGDLAAARKDYEQCLAIRQRLSAANPTSAQLQSAVALDFFDLGEVEATGADASAAVSAYQQSLAIRKRLAAADPTNADLQQLILKTLTRLARYNNTGVTWAQVAQQYEAIRAAGHLTPGDEKVFDALRAHGAAGNL